MGEAFPSNISAKGRTGTAVVYYSQPEVTQSTSPANYHLPVVVSAATRRLPLVAIMPLTVVTACGWLPML